AGAVQIGKMLVFATGMLHPRYIINFPTKKHWRTPSRLEYIQQGLEDLVRVVQEHGIRSIAIPPLGCGQGGCAGKRCAR
ncbi:MAG: macro domain-containing protein, partial [Fimbriimonadales bacterium]|nr:macro domain-containing protein [Fimbriimonadales bacterium]